MPGVFGVVPSTGGQKDRLERTLRAMADRMRHRSTYRVQTHVADDVAVGRLGPSFLNPEPQPVFNSDRTLCLVFEGELFEPERVTSRLGRNGSTPADSDAALVLRALESRGPGVVADLAGAYVGFLYDARERTGHLFTDRLGLRGCYWAQAPDGTFCFASEFKAVAAAPGLRREIDRQAVAEFLSRGFPFFDRTFFEEVKFLPHGSVLTLRGGSLSLSRYWDVPGPAGGAAWRFEDAVNEGAEVLARAVGRQFRQRGRIGVMLSGGLDSRAIAAGAVASGHGVETFTFGGEKDTERELARRVAERLGVPNHRLAVPPDYLADFGLAGMWYTDAMIPCREVYWTPHLAYLGERVDALLSGHLAGLFLGGLFLEPKHLQPLPRDAQGEIIARQVAGEFSTFLSTGLTEATAREARDAFRVSREQVASGVGDRGLAAELAGAYMGTLERRLDSICYANLWSVVADVKYPFGDYEVLDFSARVPEEWRLGSRLYKAILCKAFPNLVDIPCVSAKTNWVPTRLDAAPDPVRVAWRRVARRTRFLVSRLSGGYVNLPPDRSKFTHDNHWYRTVPRVRQWFESILLDLRTLDRGYYDREGIRRLLRLQMTRGYLFDLLSRLVAFEYWNRFFIDGEAPPRCDLGQAPGADREVSGPWRGTGGCGPCSTG